jgi:hypothetical protein
MIFDWLQLLKHPLRYGFKYRGSFGDYDNDPNSVFMAKKL